MPCQEQLLEGMGRGNKTRSELDRADALPGRPAVNRSRRLEGALFGQRRGRVSECVVVSDIPIYSRPLVIRSRMPT